MTQREWTNNLSDEKFAEWLVLIEKAAIEHQNKINKMSYNELKTDWINFLKEEHI